MDVARWIIAACCWLAGNVFFIASIVSMRKGYPDAAFRNAIEGLLCMVVVAVVLP